MSTVSLPEVHAAEFKADFSATFEWLKEHWREHIGKWVVLDGGRLIGQGDDPRPIVVAARAEGVTAPFVEFIRDETEPFMGGWS